jgi:hypothetical protein
MLFDVNLWMPNAHSGELNHLALHRSPKRCRFFVTGTSMIPSSRATLSTLREVAISAFSSFSDF